MPGARHELLMEQDRFRMQVLAAFDAFVPGTPLFGYAQRIGLLEQRQRRRVHALVAGGDDAPAASGGPFSQVVTMPPAPAMIGISGSTS